MGTQEKLEEKVTFESLNPKEDIPEAVKTQLEDGDMLVKARTLHNSFLPEPWLSRLAKDSINQRILWRHRDPEGDDAGHIFGRVLTADVKGDFIESYLRIFGGPEDSPEKNLQNLIKLKFEDNDPIGISKGFIKYYNKNGEIRRVTSLEDSITYIPQCKSCKTIEVKMEMDEKELKAQIKKLQNELNASKMELENKDNSLKEYEDKVKGFESKIEEFEAKVKVKETEKETLEDKLVGLSDKVKNLTEKLEYEGKKPLIEEIHKYEQDDMLLDIYKSWDVKKLEERLTKVKEKYSEPQIKVTTLEEQRKIALEKEDKLDVGNKVFRGADMHFLEMLQQIEKEDKILGVE